MPADLDKLVRDAILEPDPARQTEMWIDYQKRMVDTANLMVLFQPIYQTVVRDTVKTFPLTAAGMQVELQHARP